MSKQLATINNPEQSLLSVIAKAAGDPNVDVSKIVALLDMQERILVHQREIAFNEAMAQMEPKLPVIQKTKTAKIKEGFSYTYAPNEEIDTQIRPLLREYGFSLYFDSSPAPGGLAWTGHLKHAQGHVRSATIVLPPDASGGKNNVQAMGSASSYARRYTTCLLLNLITKDMKDDDGRGTSVITEEQAKVIDTLITQSGADRKRFLEYIKADAVADIQQADFVRATQRLTDKMNAKPKA
jgi:hypothetical protein